MGNLLFHIVCGNCYRIPLPNFSIDLCIYKHFFLNDVHITCLSITLYITSTVYVLLIIFISQYLTSSSSKQHTATLQALASPSSFRAILRDR